MNKKKKNHYKHSCSEYKNVIGGRLIDEVKITQKMPPNLWRNKPGTTSPRLQPLPSYAEMEYTLTQIQKSDTSMRVQNTCFQYQNETMFPLAE